MRVLRAALRRRAPRRDLRPRRVVRGRPPGVRRDPDQGPELPRAREALGAPRDRRGLHGGVGGRAPPPRVRGERAGRGVVHALGRAAEDEGRDEVRHQPPLHERHGVEQGDEALPGRGDGGGEDRDLEGRAQVAHVARDLPLRRVLHRVLLGDAPPRDRRAPRPQLLREEEARRDPRGGRRLLPAHRRRRRRVPRPVRDRSGHGGARDEERAAAAARRRDRRALQEGRRGRRRRAGFGRVHAALHRLAVDHGLRQGRGGGRGGGRRRARGPRGRGAARGRGRGREEEAVAELPEAQGRRRQEGGPQGARVGHREEDDQPRRQEGAWKSNLQPDFNVCVFECFDTGTFAVLRGLDESNRSVQKSAESTSM